MRPSRMPGDSLLMQLGANANGEDPTARRAVILQRDDPWVGSCRWFAADD